jgi:hypothetical protein
MRRVTVRSLTLGLMLAGGIAMVNPASSVRAEDFGGIEPGTWVLGMRAGFAPVTQTISEVPGFSTSAHVGSLVNFQAMYSLNKWLLVGMMLEWERRAVDRERPTALDLGHQDTVSVLPTVELRPAKFGPVSPYVNMSFGVNVNSFGEDRGVGRISPSNTFAWRLGWGADYMLTNRVALNTEMAYKRNDGHATINGTRVNDWNASSFGFLVGAKVFF